jgi:hypothetical protein
MDWGASNRNNDMTVQCKFERSLLAFEEYEVLRATHHPAIQERASDELQAARGRLREMRDKERTHARHKRREARGKADARGSSFPGTAERPVHRKQVFAAALKRLNKELNRRRSFEARAANIEAAHSALALRRAGGAAYRPAPGHTAHKGMRPKVSARRGGTKVPRSSIGSISQATKVSQAIRDGRS